MRTSALVLVLLVAGLAAPTPAQAQFTGSPQEMISQGTSYRIFARPGEATIRVQVLGDIGAGIYMLSPRTTLSELLALGGGAPLSDAGAQVRRIVTVRLLRGDGGTRQVVYESELRQMLREPEAYPALQDGDIVTVESTIERRYTFRETVQLVSSLASITLLLLRLSEQF